MYLWIIPYTVGMSLPGSCLADVTFVGAARHAAGAGCLSKPCRCKNVIARSHGFVSLRFAALCVGVHAGPLRTCLGCCPSDAQASRCRSLDMRRCRSDHVMEWVWCS